MTYYYILHVPTDNFLLKDWKFGTYFVHKSILIPDKSSRLFAKYYSWQDAEAELEILRTLHPAVYNLPYDYTLEEFLIIKKER